MMDIKSDESSANHASAIPIKKEEEDEEVGASEVNKVTDKGSALQGDATLTVDDIKKESEEEEEKEDVHLYSYIDRDYTTEIFKIEIRNLPRRTDHRSFYTFLRKNDIKFRKAKVIQANSFKGDANSHAYVTLKSAKEREEALKKLNGIKFRGHELTASESCPLPDPLLMKRRENGSKGDNGSSRKRARTSEKDEQNGNLSTAKSFSKATIDDNFDDLPEEKQNELINTQVASLWSVPYPEQLTQKAAHLQKVMKTTFYDLLKICQTLPKESANRVALDPTLNFFRNVKIEGSIIQSPVIDTGYRNKCEFNIDAARTVGFRLGQYKEGTMRVVRPPANCPLVSPQMQQVLAHFQSYLKQSNTLDGFNPLTHEGHWRQLMVRTNRSNQALISFALHRQGLTDEQVEQDIVEPVRRHFADNACGVCSIYVQVINDRTSQVQQAEPRHVDGEKYIYEKLMGGSLQFRISPLSFFQINTDAAELLYSKIAELSSCQADSIVLDICCGTGTIGLCVARSVRKVIGIELNEDAVKDARFNAELNNVGNIEFHCGRAEQLIGQILGKLGPDDKDVVAILDPPRSGLAASLIKAVRNNEKITRLVYVSCEANAARRNFIDLCRPKSNAYFGQPFVPRTAIPVDMFPHTERCELILLFERAQPNASAVTSTIDATPCQAESN